MRLPACMVLVLPKAIPAVPPVPDSKMVIAVPDVMLSFAPVVISPSAADVLIDIVVPDDTLLSIPSTIPPLPRAELVARDILVPAEITTLLPVTIDELAPLALIPSVVLAVMLLLLPAMTPPVPAAVNVILPLVELVVESLAKLPRIIDPLVELFALSVRAETAERLVFKEEDVPSCNVTPVAPLIEAVVPEE